MVWHLPIRADEIFRRNPLISVVCQLRFHPILQIRERIAGFQERLRDIFPTYSEIVANVVTIETAEADAVNLQTEQQFRFAKIDGSSALILTTNSLAIENRHHTERQPLLQDILKATNALQEDYAPIIPTRLGLRYINSIDRSLISKDIHREVEWKDIMAHEFWPIPNVLMDIEDTHIFTQLRSTTERDGELVLRYGLLREADGNHRYRFDMDRYFQGSFDLSTLEEKLELFGRDIFCLFRTAMGPALQEWMEQP